jgi:hypothetical protein
LGGLTQALGAMTRFHIALTAILLSSCANTTPSTVQIKADYARIDPRCKNISIEAIKKENGVVWVTITEKCHGYKNGKIQFQYKRSGGDWTLVWYAALLYGQSDGT